jgi:uncharacterized glyoxalase superfamily protein PhnB/uncharacterized protein YndB with AHSA1/START domain
MEEDSMQIHPYLTFNGNAAEAMTFYQQVLDGKLDVSHFSDMPDCDENTIQAEDRDRVMHARLQCGEAVLMASDSFSGQPAGPMDGFSIALVFTDMARAVAVFEGLGTGGNTIMPWGPTFWAEGFGMLKDKYGVAWIINCGLMQSADSRITIETSVAAGIEEVWRAWNTPADIKQWNAASDDWHTTSASVDLHVDGTFTARMEARDGSMGFDFSGTYTRIVPNSVIEYQMDDGRVVTVEFSQRDGNVLIRESFDPEPTHSIEEQREGWQAILERFARYVEKGGAGS